MPELNPSTVSYLKAIVGVVFLTFISIVAVYAIKPHDDNTTLVTMILGFAGTISVSLFKGLQTNAAIADAKKAVIENTDLTAASKASTERKAEEVKAEVQSVKEIVQGKP